MRPCIRQSSILVVVPGESTSHRAEVDVGIGLESRRRGAGDWLRLMATRDPPGQVRHRRPQVFRFQNFYVITETEQPGKQLLRALKLEFEVRCAMSKRVQASVPGPCGQVDCGN